MKRPIYPHKPYKPSPPVLEKNIIHKKHKFENDVDLESILRYLKIELEKDIKPEEIYLSTEIDYGYYDETKASIIATYSYEDPNDEVFNIKANKKFEHDTKQYEKAFKKYKEENLIFKERLKEYNKQFELFDLEQAKKKS